MKILRYILALIWLGITVLAVVDEGTLSFRLPFICVSFGLAAVLFLQHSDGGDRHG